MKYQTLQDKISILLECGPEHNSLKEKGHKEITK